MRKKQLALEVIERLKKEYPDAHCTLDYDKAWQLLVSVRLAAQCTDARVDQVTPKLYEKFPTIEALANADVDEIEKIVHPCGLGHPDRLPGGPGRNAYLCADADARCERPESCAHGTGRADSAAGRRCARDRDCPCKTRRGLCVSVLPSGRLCACGPPAGAVRADASPL